MSGVLHVSVSVVLLQLFSLIFIALTATLSGCTTCFQIALFARTKQQALREQLGIKGRMPSHDTFSRIFRILDPQAKTEFLTQDGKGRGVLDDGLRQFTGLVQPRTGRHEVVRHPEAQRLLRIERMAGEHHLGRVLVEVAVEVAQRQFVKLLGRPVSVS